MTREQHIAFFLTKLRNATNTGKREALANDLAVAYDLTLDQASEVLKAAAEQHRQDTPTQFLPPNSFADISGSFDILPAAIEIAVRLQTGATTKQNKTSRPKDADTIIV